MELRATMLHALVDDVPVVLVEDLNEGVSRQNATLLAILRRRGVWVGVLDSKMPTTRERNGQPQACPRE